VVIARRAGGGGCPAATVGVRCAPIIARSPLVSDLGNGRVVLCRAILLALYFQAINWIALRRNDGLLFVSSIGTWRRNQLNICLKVL